MNRGVQPELFVPGSAVVHHCASSCRRRVGLRASPSSCETEASQGRRGPQRFQGRPMLPRETSCGSEKDSFTRAKPAAAGEASPKRDLIHGAQQRRDSDLTAQCSGSSTTPCRQLAWQLRNCGAVQRPTVAALGEGLFLASSRHARAPEARDCTRRRRRREHEQTDPRKRAKSSPLARRRSQTPTIAYQRR